MMTLQACRRRAARSTIACKGSGETTNHEFCTEKDGFYTKYDGFISYRATPRPWAFTFLVVIIYQGRFFNRK